MKDTLTLAIIQSNLFWEDPQSNLIAFEKELSALKGKVDLAVLPETFSTAFTMQVERFADKNNETLHWMINNAKKNNIILTGSIIVKESGHFYNRLYWIDSNGKVDFYDKRHLFRMGGERKHFTHGKARKIVKIGEIRILLQICYDLRFPVYSRNRGDYDVLLYVANWPAVRKNAWDTLLPARAIENQAYVIAANRCGIDGLGADTCGNSCVIDPKGYFKARLNDQPRKLLSSIDINELNEYKKNFPVYEDADKFKLL